MNRFNKYLVIKRDDIEKHLSDEHQLKLDLLTTKIRIGRLNEGKQDQSYVVVAADWPMYEQVWSMVESFVDGTPNIIEQQAKEIAELKALAKKMADALYEIKLRSVSLADAQVTALEALSAYRELIKE